VIVELRQSQTGGPALVPSIRTMRRWFAQGRWLLPSALERVVPAQSLVPLTLRPNTYNVPLPTTPHLHRLSE
jgi:hypothetical protein